MIYEYSFGVFIEAASEEEAWEKVRPISEQLDKLDIESASTTDGPFEIELET